MITLDIAGEKLSKLDKVSNKTNVISSRNKIKRLPDVSYQVFSHQSRFVPSQLSRFAPVPKAIFETTVAWRATQDDLFLLEPTRYLISYSKTFCNFDLLLVTRNDLHKLMAKIGLKLNKSRGVISFYVLTSSLLKEDGDGVGFVNMSKEWYDQVKIKSTESEEKYPYHLRLRHLLSFEELSES